MSSIRRLAGQTAIYGIPSILGRILSYLLVPLYTRVFDPDAYGTVSVLYSFAAFLNVILTYGMETAFFRYSESETNKNRVFSTGMISLLVTTGAFLIAIYSFSGSLASWMHFAEHPEYILWFAWILGLDALSAIPFAQLRSQNKPGRFALIRFINILVNIGLNLFFILLCPWYVKHHPDGAFSPVIHLVYRSDWGIEYIFISNLISSLLTFAMLTPQILRMKWEVDKRLLREMLSYAFPLLFAGMAGIVNETFDRILLFYLLPPGTASAQVGIYGACYKISILMTIFIQAYRFAAEPFFFSHSKEKDSKLLYARIMDYFMIVVSVIFLVTMLYLDDFIMPLFLGKKYWAGKNVIPVLMLANLFLGVYYNLSIWYKLTGKTSWGAWFSLFGAIVTLVLNFLWIPLTPDHAIFGYLGSAWATFICYGAMMVLSYIAGQRYYRIPYNLVKCLGYPLAAVGIWFLAGLWHPDHRVLSILYHSFVLLVFAGCVFLVERPRLAEAR
jgi:O-antigen/teichoic acid export membrane protein